MQNPSPWRETSETNEFKVIEKYFNDHIKVWDADNCGYEEIYFAFDTGKAFILKYDWWCDYDSEEYIKDEWEIEEIYINDAKGICTNRDWLTLKQ